MISPIELQPAYWVPVWSDPILAADAEALAQEIAGEGARADMWALARPIAEAKIDLRRVFEAREKISQFLPPGQQFVDLIAAARFAKVKSPIHVMVLDICHYERRVVLRLAKAEKAYQIAERRKNTRRRQVYVWMLSLKRSRAWIARM